MVAGYHSSRQNAGMRKRPGRRFFSLLAMLSVALNFLVPVTHGFLMTAEAGEFLEICTRNGIELVRLDIDGSKEETLQGVEDEACSACADCPVCYFGAIKPVLLQISDVETDRVSGPQHFTWPASRVLTRAPPWIRPSPRAPPLA